MSRISSSLRNRILISLALPGALAACAETDTVRYGGDSEPVFTPLDGSDGSDGSEAAAGDSESLPNPGRLDDSFEDVDEADSFDDYTARASMTALGFDWYTTLTVAGVQPGAEVRLFVSSQLGTTCVPGGCVDLEDAEMVVFESSVSGLVQIDYWPGTQLAALDSLYVQALVTTAEGSFLTEVVSETVPNPTCAWAQPADVEFDAANPIYLATYRVCEDVPLGGCEAITQFDGFTAWDKFSEAVEDNMPFDWTVREQCQETTIPDQCCYVVDTFNQAIFDANNGGGGGGGGGWDWAGRPFQVDGRNRSAVPVAGDTWQHSLNVDASKLSRKARRRLATYWSKLAVEEHASVASFARLALEALSLGAPAELLVDITQAQVDEINHAKLSFELASVFLGEPVRASKVNIDGALNQSADVAAVLRSAIREGCINETLCAAEVAMCAERTEDPLFAAQVAIVAEDEARHAALSWRWVKWILAEYPELHDVAVAEFASYVPNDRPLQDVDQAELAAFGAITDFERWEMARRTMRTVVEPARKALLG